VTRDERDSLRARISRARKAQEDARDRELAELAAGYVRDENGRRLQALRRAADEAFRAMLPQPEREPFKRCPWCGRRCRWRLDVCKDHRDLEAAYRQGLV
jgi:hypothetical protein